MSFMVFVFNCLQNQYLCDRHVSGELGEVCLTSLTLVKNVRSLVGQRWLLNSEVSKELGNMNPKVRV